jgi:hypothetical protein
MNHRPTGRSGGRPFATDLRFFGTIAAVVVILVTVVALCHGMEIGRRAFPPGFWNLVSPAIGWGAALLPFSAFAGGAAVQRRWSARAILPRAIMVTIFSYALLAYGTPLLRYRAAIESGTDVSAQYPLGPGTPGDLREQRSYVESNPPTEYSFRIARPLNQPPNWLTYLIHSLMALALFSLLSILLGHQTAEWTTGLSPPVRFNARWAAGLLTGGLFFAALVIGGDWVREDPSHSALVGAWLPLMLPVLLLLGMTLLIRRRNQRRPSSAVQVGE